MLVSACLVGVPCSYDARPRTMSGARELLTEKRIVPLCPEVLGGLGVPRERIEIQGGEGKDVLSGKARVVTESGLDVSSQLLEGVKIVVELVRALKIDEAILRARSPSCGFGEIYDGTFSGKLKKGNGVLAEALKREGVKIWVAG